MTFNDPAAMVFALVDLDDYTWATDFASLLLMVKESRDHDLTSPFIHIMYGVVRGDRSLLACHLIRGVLGE